MFFLSISFLTLRHLGLKRGQCGNNIHKGSNIGIVVVLVVK